MRVLYILLHLFLCRFHNQNIDKTDINLILSVEKSRKIKQTAARHSLQGNWSAAQFCSSGKYLHLIAQHLMEIRIWGVVHSSRVCNLSV